MQPVCKMNWLYLLQILMTEMREEQLLQAAGIKPTAARILIIRNLDAADHPLSMAEIGDALETVDKSVISRTLALFRSARLIHIIQDGSDSVRYELCRCHCSVSGDDSDRHIREMLLWDVNNGIARRSWARNDAAIRAIRREMERTPLLQVTLPNFADPEVVRQALGE